MAVRKAKRNVHRAQPAHRTNPDKIVHFPEVAGKVLGRVEFVTSDDYDAIVLSFRDNTCLNLSIEPGFSLQANYLDRIGGDHRVLKRWPLTHTVRFRKS